MGTGVVEFAHRVSGELGLGVDSIKLNRRNEPWFGMCTRHLLTKATLLHLVESETH